MRLSLLLLLLASIVGGCRRIPDKLPAEFNGAWSRSIQQSNYLWKTYFQIDENRLIANSEEYEIGVATNRSFTLNRINRIRVLNKVKTTDGDTAYVIEIKRLKGTGTVHTDSAAAQKGLWGISDWKPNEPRDEPLDKHKTAIDIVGVDSSHNPPRLYHGYCPPEGRIETEPPTKFDKEIYLQKVP